MELTPPQLLPRFPDHIPERRDVVCTATRALVYSRSPSRLPTFADVVELENMVAIDITGSMERVGNSAVGTQYRKSMVIISHFQWSNANASQFDSTYPAGAKLAPTYVCKSKKPGTPVCNLLPAIGLINATKILIKRLLRSSNAVDA
jgi:hypothetical protein